MRYGRKIQGRLVAVPESLRVSKPGEVYELHIYTDEPFEEDTALFNQLLLLEQQYPDLKVEYVETWSAEKTIVLQVKDLGPGGFAIGGIISLIPTLFILIGIVVVGYILWQTLETNPILLWLGALAGGVIIFYYFIGAKLDKPTTIRTKAESDSTAKRASAKLSQLNSERVGAQNESDTHRKTRDKMTEEIKRTEDKIEKLQKNKPKGYTKEVQRVKQELEKIEGQKAEAVQKYNAANEKHEKVLEQIRAIQSI